MVKPSQAVAFRFSTFNSDGANEDATVGPTGAIYVNGTVDAGSVTVQDVGTGEYKASLAVPATCVAGDFVQVRISATVDGAAIADYLWADVVDTERVSDLTDEVIGTGTGLTALGDTRLGNLDAAVSTRGTGVALDAAGVRTAVGLASANLDTQLAALPTDADVNAACDTALADAGVTSTRMGYLTGPIATAAKLLSLIQSIARKDVTVDTDIGGTYDDATDSLQAIRDRGDAAWTTGGSGSGAIEFTYTVTRSDTGAPLQGVIVRACSDLAGDNTVAEGTTDALGKVVLNLDAGTYYFFRRLSGYAFTDPDTETVSA